MTAGIVAAHYADISVAAYSTEVLADSPLVYLKLDETTGSTFADSSGNSRAGTKNGSPVMNHPTVMPAGSGSLELNATTEFVSIADAAWMDANPFTVEAWIRPVTTTGIHAIIGRDGGAASRGWNFYLRDGLLQCNNPNTSTVNNGGTTLTASSVYHCAMTFDGTNAALYLNGALDGTAANALVTNLSNPLRIGTTLAGGGTSSFTLNGDIDHVAMYGTALSSGRIATHYAAASVGA